ncbi:hypothetical protein BDZ90DRAFT_25700 [Jaminaea rosea]|uniref:SET domain-containing protein n=1 Tax=Jaminaea rosea TaxID=1569628 RepID=A0A316UZW3_9BASI|nr:hypothetical protein BDZ90DRAFT_25700 [Jaminaea rosea]PWN30840.1 hypothetical protein BDZ90DRAFT_25700 [Jaminaea rosea]
MDVRSLDGRQGDQTAPDVAMMDAGDTRPPDGADAPRPETSIAIPPPQPISLDQQADEGADTTIDGEAGEDEDGGVIRCICGISDDDGFTIQCDRCLVWQHCACFGMSSASVPDEYLCELCDPRPVNVAFAQAHQQRRLEHDARKAKAERAFIDRRMSEVAKSPVEAPSSSPSLPLQPLESASKQSSSPQLPPPKLPIPPRSRKPSQNIDLSNTEFVAPDLPTPTAGPSKPSMTGRRKPGPKPGSRKTPLATPTSASATTPKTFSFPPTTTPREDKTEDDALTAAEKMEAWHFDFTPISRNLVTESRVIDVLAAAMVDYDAGSPLKAVQDADGRLRAPLAAMPDQLATEGDDAEQFDVDQMDANAANASTAGHVFGLSAIGNECVPIELHASSLSSVACPVYVRNISDAASAAVFTNVSYIATLPNERARPWCATRAFSKPSMHGLFAESAIRPGSFITEYRGELTTAESYRADPMNQYGVLGATKPHAHLFPPPLSLAIDARRFGTEARFARFGCHPNAVLRPILFYRDVSGQEMSDSPHSISRAGTPTFTHLATDELPSAEAELRFGLFALTSIKPSQEIILGWEWDDQHIVHFLPEIIRNPALETPSRPRSVTVVEMADKGDFPYASTIFSNKMNAATAALLSITLCSCIGSATPQAGSGSSGSHSNARKHDCAVAQMLRVGQGMGLLNVNIPGSARNTHRRVKTPDFSPLVGARRAWRSLGMPPLTPPQSHIDEGMEVSLREQVLRSGRVPTKLLPNGRVARVYEADLAAAIGAVEAASFDRKSESILAAALHEEGEPSSPLGPYDSDDDATDSDATASDASSLTEPLSGLSQISDDDDDEDGLTAIKLEDEEAGPAVLPLKKRIAGTRLKANHIHHDDPDAEDKTNRGNARKAQRAAATMKARAEAKELKRRVAAGRKGAKPSKRATPFASSSDEDEEAEIAGQKVTAPRKKVSSSKRAGGSKRSALADPSSPLSSAPGNESDRDMSDDDGAAPPRADVRIPSAIPEIYESDLSEEEDDDPSEPIGRRPSHSGEHGDRDDDAGLKRKKKKKDKKAAEKERRRSELAALADSESSVEDEQEQQRSKKRKIDTKAGKESKKKRKRRMASTMMSDSESDGIPSAEQKMVETKQESSPMLPPFAEGRGDGEAEMGPDTDAQAPAEPEREPTPVPAPEPEKPRAKLSLADWKKQQAEKRKASLDIGAATSAAAGMSPPSATVSGAGNPLDQINTTQLATPVSVVPPSPSVFSPNVEMGTASSTAMTPQAPLPPAPLPPRSMGEAYLAPRSQADNYFPPPAPLAPTSMPQAGSAGGVDTSSMPSSAYPSASPAFSPPASVSTFGRQVLSPSPMPGAGMGSNTSSAALASPTASSSASGSGSFARPMPPAPAPPPPTAAPMTSAPRRPSYTSQGSPPPPRPVPLASSASPPSKAPLPGWGARSASMAASGGGGAMGSVPPPLPPPSHTGARPSSRPPPPAPMSAAPQAPTATGAGGASTQSFRPVSAAGPSTFEPPPSPRVRPHMHSSSFSGTPLGSNTPGGPAALRLGGSPPNALGGSAGPGASGGLAAPFNPPKGPKALMNQQQSQHQDRQQQGPPGGNAATSGPNATPIGHPPSGAPPRQHSNSVTSSSGIGGGSPPSFTSDLPPAGAGPAPPLNAPSGPKPKGLSGSVDGGSPPPSPSVGLGPQRLGSGNGLSILGRGGGAMGANAGERGGRDDWDARGGAGAGGMHGGFGPSGHGHSHGGLGGHHGGHGHGGGRGWGGRGGGRRGGPPGAGGGGPMPGSGWGARARGRGRGGGPP